MNFKIRNILSILFLFSLQHVFAQSVDERNNRAVFNRIEYFINAEQPDSIYELAAPVFKQQITKEQLSGILIQLFSLGKVKNATQYDFNKGIAKYKTEFEKETLSIVLGIDSNMQYHTLAFQPYSGPKDAAVDTSKKEIIANVAPKNPLDNFVDSVARNYAKQGSAQALAVAIIHKNKINTFFYGETDKGNNTLPDANTLFEIGSISKTFTASLLAEMVNKGQVKLEESIAKYLPDSVAQNPAIQKITFKSLANHTSGLPRLADNWKAAQKFSESDPYAAYDRKLLFGYLKKYQAKEEPESKYEYSNLGFGLLGELLSIIAKKPYMTLVKESILTPLEMTATADKIDPKIKNFAPPHDDSGNKVPFWSFQSMAGAGALKSSLNDMLRYTIAQLTYPETDIQKAMNLTKQFTFFVPPNSDIGLAWHINMLEGVNYYFHNGGTGGSSSFLGFVPDEKAVVIILSNSAKDVTETGTILLEKVLTTP